MICGRLDLVQVLQDGIELGLVTDEVEDGAPVSVLHVARHQVAGVVLEDLGACEQRSDCPGLVVGVGAEGHPLVRRELPAARHPDRLGFGRGQVAKERPGLRRVLEHRPRRRGADVRAGVLGVDVGEREEVEVGPSHQARVGLGEEGRDEGSLVQHVALRWVLEHRSPDVPEVGVDDVVGAAVDVGVAGAEDLAEGRPRRLDRGRGPLRLALPPAVVCGWTDRAERDLFVEVAAGPAGGGSTLHRHAPRRGAVRLDLVLERDHVLPCLGHRVALGREDLGAVPDQTLEVRPGEDLDEVAADGAEVDPALVVIRLELGHVHDVLEVDHLPLVGESGQEGRTGRGRQVGRVAGCNPGGQDGVLVPAGLVVDGDAGLGGERREHGVEGVELAV